MIGDDDEPSVSSLRRWERNLLSLGSVDSRTVVDTKLPRKVPMRVEIERIIDGETGGERFWVYEVTGGGGRRKAVSSASNMLRAHEIEDDYKRRNVTVKWIDRR